MPISRAGISSRSTRKKGFTLIELVLVVAMVGIIVAIVLPRLDPFVPRRRLKSAARILSGTISLAYGEAIAKNKVYRLYVDTADDKYWITEAGESEEDEDTGAAGIRLGTHFELLEYSDGAENAEKNTPSEPMLAPKKLPPGVHFSSLEMQQDTMTAAVGPQYIEFSPLGIASPATINLVNDDGGGFAIRYDGVTGIPALIPLNSETG